MPRLELVQTVGTRRIGQSQELDLDTHAMQWKLYWVGIADSVRQLVGSRLLVFLEMAIARVAFQ